MQLELLRVQILVSTAAEALVVGRRKPREEGGWWAAECEQQPQCRTHFSDGDETRRQELFPDRPIKQNFADISLSLDKLELHIRTSHGNSWRLLNRQEWRQIL
jgi:hypothetical protein